jgi:hypothetical protein
MPVAYIKNPVECAVFDSACPGTRGVKGGGQLRWHAPVLVDKPTARRRWSTATPVVQCRAEPFNTNPIWAHGAHEPFMPESSWLEPSNTARLRSGSLARDWPLNTTRSSAASSSSWRSLATGNVSWARQTGATIGRIMQARVIRPQLLSDLISTKPAWIIPRDWPARSPAESVHLKRIQIPSRKSNPREAAYLFAGTDCRG